MDDCARSGVAFSRQASTESVIEEKLMRVLSAYRASVLAVSLAFPLAAAMADTPASNSQFGIRTLSTHPDRVSGGDVLVEISYPNANSKFPLVVTLNGRDVSAAFRAGEKPNTLLGLVTGLALGKNTLAVEGRGWGMPARLLELTNYSIKGPIVSGPYQQPFICQTQNFNLPAGLGTLGAPLDADCSVATRVDYLYISTAGGGFRQLPSTSVLPAGVAMTKTRAGVTG